MQTAPDGGSTAVADRPYYDPFSRQINADPYPWFKRLRDEAPLYYNEELGFYALSRFADLQAARLDTATFSNATGVLFERMLDRNQPQTMLLDMDPPQHTALRRVTNRYFTPKAMNQLTQTVRDLCREFLDAQVGSGGFDYVTDFAKPLPMMVTSSLLGLSRAEQDELRPVFDERESALAREHCDMQQVVALERRIRDRLMAVAEERRAEPRDDLISVLVQGQVDDPATGLRPLTDEEIKAYCLVLYSGGNSTTTLLMSWMAYLLAKHPDQRQKLIDQPELIPNGIEEILRFQPVSHTQGRTTTKSVELYGQTVPARAKFLLLTASACRDERRYDRPDDLDVTREVGNHMAFGWGIHSCIGAHLARLEGRIALEETLKRFPAFEVHETVKDMRISSSMRGYYALPITF